MKLNPRQLRAVESDSTFKVIFAGPGSGKTRTLVEAAKRANHFGTNTVAIMTFTQNGAAEFRERLLGTPLAYCGTTHGYMMRLLNRFGDRLGYVPGSIGIIPEEEVEPRLMAIAKSLGKKMSQEKLFKGTALTASEKAIRDIAWAEFEFVLKRNNLVHYDGMLRDGLALLRMPDVRDACRFDYLFIDEGQDSAAIDWEIYYAISAENKMIVGDFDQSIFSFRGAHPQGLIDSANSHDSEVILLETNYRSDVDICDAANKLIAHNPGRLYLKLIKPIASAKGVRCVARLESASEECYWIPKTINENHFTRGTAVLARTNALADDFRAVLKMAGIFVQESNYVRRTPDWKRALLLIGLATNPSDILVERYLRLDHGAAEVENWRLGGAAGGDSFIERANIRRAGILSVTAVGRYLLMNGVSGLTAREIDARVQLIGSGVTWSDLLQDLMSPKEDPEQSGSGVYVGTIHSSKGREFDHVFLPAFEQGILPLAKQSIEEERRLAFVAITRARHGIYISHTGRRMNQWNQTIGGEPSQFIAEMGL